MHKISSGDISVSRELRSVPPQQLKLVRRGTALGSDSTLSQMGPG
jgi:hypothetical protein